MSTTIAIRGNAFDYLKDIPDKTIDWLIADPPYFSGPETRQFYGAAQSKIGAKRRTYPVQHPDTWKVPTPEDIDEMIRVSKNQVIWGCNYYKYPFGPGRIIWDKCNGASSFSDAEIAYCSSFDSVRLFRFLWNGAMQGESLANPTKQQGNKKLNEPRIHTCQKPIPVYHWLYQKLGIKPGMTVLDPYLGSGTHRVVAHKLGVLFTGFEIDETNFENHEKFFTQMIYEPIAFNS